MLQVSDLTLRVRIALAATLVAASVVAWGASLLRPVNPSAAAVMGTIPDGTSAQGVGALLAANGVVRSAWVFTLVARLTGQGTRLQAGRYALCPCDSTPALVRAIASGAALSDDVQVTIPEGSNVWQVDRILATAKLAQLGIFARAHRNDEGELFPDTYRFAKDATDSDIATEMKSEFTGQAKDATISQVIIASILEKEAKTPADMALVAGIIMRRLALKMPLQVDATVAYGWCLRTMRAGTDCDVTQAPVASELSVDGPYNTYSRVGLPAGPISNPGATALYAAQHPQASDYLYYLSTRDGSQLIYAKTAAEHLANRQKYLGF